jgi:hypothetical protein
LAAATGQSGVIIQSVEDYLDIMGMPHTHIDEFVLAAVARTWEVRVAVLERRGQRITTENTQFVPNRRIEEERTIFIVRRGSHFEWAHSNSAPCKNTRCAMENKRVSAQHVPFQACISIDDTPTVATSDRPVSLGAQPTSGGDAVFQALREQLLEEYPHLSPDRAEAALRLTKQNGRFSIYRASRVLPGREGAPIVLTPPSGSSGSDKRVSFSSSKASNTSSDWIDPGSDASGSERETSGPFTPHNEGDGCAIQAHQQQATCSGAMPSTGSQQLGGGGCCSAGSHQHERGGCCAENVGQNNTDSVAPWDSHLVDQAIQFASQTVSLSAKCSFEDARAALCKHITLCGNLTVAAQRAFQELMDGAPVDVVIPPANLPTGGGLRLVERTFGAEGRTQSAQAMAKRSRGDDRSTSPPQWHLFDNALAEQMRNAGANLTAEQRLSTGIRRTEQQLFRDAQVAERATARRLQQQLDEADNEGDGNTPASAALVPGNAKTMRGVTHPNVAVPTSATSRATFHSSPHVRVAQQMKIKREQAASAPNGAGAVLVVNSAGSKLPVWRAGAESEGRGFNWRTKQKMAHAWEAYQMSEGLHAPKSFKSMIDNDLIPTICAECNLEENDWEVLDDVTLLVAIEEKLRPHDAMDFTVQLKQIHFDHNVQKGTVTQRYRIFAEAFLGKVSEARAAGFMLPENVVKLAFTRALQGNALLQGWLEQEKWTSVGAAHRRITNSLKMVDAYQTLQTMSGAQPGQQPQPAQQPQQQVAPPQPAPPAQQLQVAPPQQGQQQAQPAAPAAEQPAGFRRQQRFNNQVQAAVNAALAGYRAAHMRQDPPAPVPAAPANINVGFKAATDRRPLQLPPFPGLDARGLHWHVHSALLGCKSFPCTAPFCQACGVHHHSADECRKRFYNNPGANHSGYWSEQRPNTAPLRNQAPVTSNVAVQSGTPPFPTPHTMHGRINATPAAANNTASTQSGSADGYAAQQQPANDKSDGKSL